MLPNSSNLYQALRDDAGKLTSVTNTADEGQIICTPASCFANLALNAQVWPIGAVIDAFQARKLKNSNIFSDGYHPNDSPRCFLFAITQSRAMCRVHND